jgi:hypothetical protein
MTKDVGQIAKEWYEQNEEEGALAGAILRCFFFGAIIRRPGFLLMGETCKTDGKIVTMERPHNAWWIHFTTYGSGTVSSYDLCLEAPFRMDWVCFKRRGKTHILSWEKLYNKDLYYGRKSFSPASASA